MLLQLLKLYATQLLLRQTRFSYPLTKGFGAHLLPKPWDSAQGIAALPIDWPPLFVELLLHCQHPVTGLVIDLLHNS
jgi:hypothetical protein